MRALSPARRVPVRLAALMAAAVAGVSCAASPSGGPVAAPAGSLDTLTLALTEPGLGSIPLEGHLRVAERAGAGAVSRIVELAPYDTAGAPFLRLLVVRPDTDLRDLVDAGPRVAVPPDLILTRNPETLSYARSRSDLVLTALPWDRVHALVVTDPSRTRVPVTAAFRASLARDAVRVDARGADSAYAWAGAACSRPRPPAGRPARAIGHDASDPTARDLAERLVALDGTVSAAPLASGALAPALAAGSHAAFVVGLSGGAGCEALPPLPAGAVVLPLVETRPHLIRRDTAPALVIRSGEPIRYAPAGPEGG